VNSIDGVFGDASCGTSFMVALWNRADHTHYTVNHKKTWQYIFDYNFG